MTIFPLQFIRKLQNGLLCIQRGIQCPWCWQELHLNRLYPRHWTTRMCRSHRLRVYRPSPLSEETENMLPKDPASFHASRTFAFEFFRAPSPLELHSPEETGDLYLLVEVDEKLASTLWQSETLQQI